MLSKPAGQDSGLKRVLSLEIVRVTERAAVAAARLRGRGAEKKSDQAAVDAMRRELSGLAINGTVVIGEGEMEEAPMLFIGEKVGTGLGPNSISPSIRWRARRCAPRICREPSPR
jgi:fructose-1,6-bisphosphatase II / sedoheptulose-1,7-bisphosphatase